MRQTAKVFMNGRSQAVRLPKEFRFEGTEVAIRRDPATGEVLLSARAEARKDMSWNELFAEWDALGPADLEFDRQVSPPVEREFF
ncbi:MAG: AbrB/MazE/SpoVT family DNA-binding domain-containing protein [Terracidiphilus sp.]